jgi:NhaA family Na+:H+ antiporter
MPTQKTRPPADHLLKPFQEFVKLESFGGLVLLLCTVASIVWANSPWAKAYFELWEIKVQLGFGDIVFSKSLHYWINEGLMAVFFFVVGLEIKRELWAGELASLKRAALPIAAALGGMILPALIFTLFNAGSESSAGWGIPMATDIAFALGVMALLGNRVPLALKIFLTALAIVDDLGAVLVIALFYTTQLAWGYVGLASLIMIGLLIANFFGVRNLIIYAILGISLWLALLESGLHATIAGVLLAMAIPVRSHIDVRAFFEKSARALDEFKSASAVTKTVLLDEEEQAALNAMRKLCREVAAPLQRLERALHPWVSYLILPLFALSNAGVKLDQNLMVAVSHPVSLGVILGLVIGKPVGITLFSWMAVKLKIAELPEEISWPQIHGAGWLGGIGFTMALFIGTLAFGESELLSMAKVGILVASVLAGSVGLILLARSSRRLGSTERK